MFKRVTHPLAKWFVVASIAWLTLAPTALRTLSGVLPFSSSWQQICTSHGEKSVHLKDASGAPQQDESTGSACPLCVFCHLSWAPAPSVFPVVDVPLGRLPQWASDAHQPRPAQGWVLQNPRAPPDFF